MRATEGGMDARAPGGRAVDGAVRGPDQARVRREIARERRAFERQEEIVRRFHAHVARQRARLATRTEENRAIVRARVEALARRRERLSPRGQPPGRGAPSGRPRPTAASPAVRVTYGGWSAESEDRG
jgi:ribosomal protein L15E